MNEELELKEYDENEAIKHIVNYLPIDIKEKYADDDILLVIDIIFEYYDKNRFFDIDAGVDDEENIDVDDLISFVKKQLRKDPDNVVDPDDVQSIVLGELDYEESLGMY